jgi:hypothetical protein
MSNIGTETEYLHVGQHFTTNSLRGCARCGETHEGELVWSPLTHPVHDVDGTLWTHWMPCPTNGEPVLMRSVDKEKIATGGTRVDAQHYMLLVSPELVEAHLGWTNRPVQFKFEKLPDGEVVMYMRNPVVDTKPPLFPS